MSDDKSFILENNQIDDVRWLCSLSESELDLLIGLKMLAVQRAKIIGHDSLAKNFDLKMLRALSFTMMEYLKEQLKDSSMSLGSTDSSECLNKSNCSKLSVNDDFSSMSIEELWSYICPDKRTRTAEIFYGNDGPARRKRKADQERVTIPESS